MPTVASTLLADPTQVALLRDLYAHARHVRADHAVYPGDSSPSGTSYPTEHTWTADHHKVSVYDDCLVYESHGKVLLSAAGVDGVRKGAQLLAAIGVLPPRFTGAPANPIRRCRYCGATSGLKMLHSNPLDLAARQWQCWDDCRDSAR